MIAQTLLDRMITRLPLNELLLYLSRIPFLLVLVGYCERNQYLYIEYDEGFHGLAKRFLPRSNFVSDVNLWSVKSINPHGALFSFCVLRTADEGLGSGLTTAQSNSKQILATTII